MAELAIYDSDPTLYLFTSLTAGSSHIVTATSRIETILRANKIPFKGVDTATDDLARKLYGRRASGKKLPLLVKQGYVVGDLEMIEEWNEYGELKEALGVTSAPVKPHQAITMPSKAPPKSPNTASPAGSAAVGVNQKENTPAATPAQNLAIRQMGAEAAKLAAAKKPTPTNISTTNPLLAEKVNSPLSAGASTPKKDTASLGGILSPKSIPLPATPNPATSSGTAKPAARKEDKKEESSSEEEDDDDEEEESSEEEEEEEEEEEDGPPRLPPATNQKPITLPIRSKGELDNPALNAGPIAVTHKDPTPITSPTGPKSFNGADVEDKTKEEIKKLEEEQAIAEVSDEDNDEEEDDDDEDEEEDSEEKSSEEEEEKAEAKPTTKETPAVTSPKTDATPPTPTTTSTPKTAPKPEKTDDKKKKSSSSASASKSKPKSHSSSSKSKTSTSTSTGDKAKQKVKAVVKPKESKSSKTSTSASGSKTSEKKSVKK